MQRNRIIATSALKTAEPLAEQSELLDGSTSNAEVHNLWIV